MSGPTRVTTACPAGGDMSGQQDEDKGGAQTEGAYLARAESGREYWLHHVIGKGAYGEVYLAECRSSHQRYAMKVLGRRALANGERVKREICNQKKLQHPHIVPLHRVELVGPYLCIMMEFMKGGSLKDYLLQEERLTESLARWFFQQLIFAVDYCHRKNIVNRDIKLENLLLDSNRHVVKLSDFGFSKDVIEHSNPHTFLGTPDYLAPEIIKESIPYDGEKVDVWCCGICLYIMLYGDSPFSIAEQMGERRDWKADSLVLLEMGLKIPEHLNDENGPVTKDGIDLLQKLLHVMPTSRISMKDIMRHPWFLVGLPDGVLDMNNRIDQTSQADIDVAVNLQSQSEIDRLVNLAHERNT